jgi:tetratricopeptide (TPR) repeat protein
VIAAALAIMLAIGQAKTPPRPARPSGPSTARAAAVPDRATLLKDAATAIREERRDEAKRLLRTAAERYNSVQALLMLARLQSGEGDAAGALESLKRARALAPNAEDVLSAQAQVALAARLPVPAILTLESLVRLCPTVGQYHYLLGVGLMTAGDMITGVESLKRADALEPNRPLTLTALGLAYNNQKLFPEAKAALTRALELDPGRTEALAAIAEAEAGLGDLTAAETHAAAALAKAPNDPTANLVFGMVRMAQQRYPEARDALMAAAAADPRSPKPEYQLSLVFARLGDQASSQQHVKLYQEKLRQMEADIKTLHESGFGGSPAR